MIDNLEGQRVVLLELIEEMETQMDKLYARLELVEQTLEDEFNAMEKALSEPGTEVIESNEDPCN